jgi:N-acetylglucosamine malate deacetylase 1
LKQQTILVIAPHPDDEVLGVGGAIARFASEGSDVYVVVVTKGYPPQFDENLYQEVRREALAAHQLLGVKETIFLNLPAAGLDTIPHRDVNSELVEVFKEVQPTILYIPFNGDMHLDHQVVFLSSLVASRPINPYAPKIIYCYETLSETNWNAPYLTPSFVPNCFVDISAHLETKMQAMKQFASQIQPFPHERSEESLRALATLRGSQVNCFAAEAFVLVRQVF